jgi:hypothetical protein
MTQHDIILKLLQEKSSMKQDVYLKTQAAFDALRNLLKAQSDRISSAVNTIDKRIRVEFKDVGIQSMFIKVAGDVLDFQMHTNVFNFQSTHPIFKHSYVRQNPQNAYSGIISIYNFLADSYKYNRLQDVGYLIARIFINREGRFWVETRIKSLQTYTSISEQAFSADALQLIIDHLIIFAIEFDLYTPPFEQMVQVTVAELQEKASAMALRTGKRLGFLGSSGHEFNIEDASNL